MFEMHLISGITDWWQGCEPPSPAKLNVKARPLARFVVLTAVSSVSEVIVIFLHLVLFANTAEFF